jgi:hypothetical protein
MLKEIERNALLIHTREQSFIRSLFTRTHFVCQFRICLLDKYMF